MDAPDPPPVYAMSRPYSNDELEAMLANIESDLVERKESLKGDARDKIRQAMCAFANDLPDHHRKPCGGRERGLQRLQATRRGDSAARAVLIERNFGGGTS